MKNEQVVQLPLNRLTEFSEHPFKVKFDSSYAGQLGTYVAAVNHQMKTEADNPTLGLLICKDMDKVEAQYALESTSQPLGISSYELSKLIPEEFRGSMPTIEEIEAELNE